MRRHLRTIQQLLRAGEAVHVTIVVHCSKGSPGTTGACLLVPARSSTIGTVGGGIMEKTIIERAREQLSSGISDPQLQTLKHRESSHGPSGLICGGAQTNLSFALRGKLHLDLIHAAIKKQASENPGRLEVTSQGFRLVDANEAAAPEVIVEGLAEESWHCSFALDSSRRILICGAGHCGCALARQMKRLDFAVTLFDERALPAKSMPSVERLLLGRPAAETLADFLDPASTYLVVMTHSFPSDLHALRVLLPQAFKFVGLMGSPPKWKRIDSELADHGVSSEDRASITSPVGLQIGSDTPEEIAVSVAAQILLMENSDA